MMPPVIVPMPVRTGRSKPQAQIDMEAAEARYHTAAEQKAFIEGVRYQRGDNDPSGWSLLVFLVLFVWLILQATAFIAGLAELDYRRERTTCWPKCRWGYVFPAYPAGCVVKKFLDGKEQ